MYTYLSIFLSLSIYIDRCIKRGGKRQGGGGGQWARVRRHGDGHWKNPVRGSIPGCLAGRPSGCPGLRLLSGNPAFRQSGHAAIRPCGCL